MSRWVLTTVTLAAVNVYGNDQCQQAARTLQTGCKQLNVKKAVSEGITTWCVWLQMADFGFVKKVLPGQRTLTLCGTPEYLAPELIVGEGHWQAADW